MTILKALYETNENLNELLFDDNFDFGTRIEKANGGNDTEITYEDVEELYVSPAVRRGIWQTLLMIDEYVAAVGRVPDKIFVEVTREDGKKGDEGRTKSRKNQLKEKYKNIDAAYADIKAALEDEKYTDLRLRQERLYLYFRQLGRCMYTGARIDLENLNTDTYDVDHILPRTYIKDDSLDNKVLVLRTKNAQKSDTYPLPAGFVGKDQYDFWKMLLSKELISRTTYDRLIRTKPLSDDDYKDFISRQKVITDQTAKAVIGLLKQKYPDTEVVFSKAKNVSDFKNKFDLFKCRETNDLHHARDAYLNVVVGNVYNTVFSTPMEMFYKDGDKWRTYNLKKMFTIGVAGAWNTEKSIKIVKDTFARHSMMVTRYATCNKGGFYDQTVYGKNDTSITAPRKGKGPLADTSRYGGYKSQTTAYFAIVSSTGKKDKKIKTIEAIPVLTSYMAKSDPDAVKKYLATYLKDPLVLISKVKIKQLVSYNGTLCYIAGVTGNRITAHNANQLFTDNKTDEYVNALLKLIEMEAKKAVEPNEDLYIIKTNREGEIKLVVNRENNIKLYKKLKDKLDNKIYFGISAFKNIKDILENGEETFMSLSIIDQAKVLLQIFKFLKCNDKKADLTLIGGSSLSGAILFNKDITDVDFKLIDFSPAGLTERIRRV
ncbi:MAG: type II CRISPR RNA-guided endonuclease Cas9 [Clostridia bacterium]|nr:type II CRISPR RNA-guided endonuclease Cas9 [Clostridia bacterium]